MVELEPPVRGDAVGHRRAFGLALKDRRKLATEQDLALDIELFGRLVTGIDPAIGTKFVELALVEVEAR